jgi:hypothetical protein
MGFSGIPTLIHPLHVRRFGPGAGSKTCKQQTEREAQIDHGEPLKTLGKPRSAATPRVGRVNRNDGYRKPQ